MPVLLLGNKLKSPISLLRGRICPTLLSMSESLEFNQYFPRKSFEISYALVRIASAVKSQSLRDHLEYHAFALLDKASSGKFTELYNHTAPLSYLLKLAAEGGFLNPANVIAVSREIEQFNAAIAEFENIDTLPVFDLSGNFSEITFQKSASAAEEPKVNNFQTSFQEEIKNPLVVNSGNGSLKSINRQIAILEKIRQFGNCRMKDIQEYLPESSERTIRYDLQDLVEQGVIERMGNGGPATFYRTKAPVEAAQ